MKNPHQQHLHNLHNRYGGYHTNLTLKQEKERLRRNQDSLGYSGKSHGDSPGLIVGFFKGLLLAVFVIVVFKGMTGQT